MGCLQAWKAIIPPEPGEPELRTHEGYEWLYVLSGRMRLLLADHDITMGPGEVAEFDTRLPHWFGPADDQPIEILSLFGKQGAGVVFSGLWSRPTWALLTTILHADARRDGRPGLPELHGSVPSDARRKAWFNYVCAIGMGVAPDRRARGPLGRSAGSTSFVLTAIGLGCVIVGVYVVSNVWKEPHCST